MSYRDLQANRDYQREQMRRRRAAEPKQDRTMWDFDEPKAPYYFTKQQIWERLRKAMGAIP
jgi:hypothetical protein